MSERPKRKCAEDAITKIRKVLAWESCSESSEAFKAAAEKMELEFNNAKRRRLEKALATPTSTDEDEQDDDEEEDDNSDGSAPSSSDLYSDPGSCSEDNEGLCESTSDSDDSPCVLLDLYAPVSAPLPHESP